VRFCAVVCDDETVAGTGVDNFDRGAANPVETPVTTFDGTPTVPVHAQHRCGVRHRLASPGWLLKTTYATASVIPTLVVLSPDSTWGGFRYVAKNHRPAQPGISSSPGGKFQEAAELYRKVIKRDPNNPHALHSLGVIEAAAGNIAVGTKCMARSLMVQPGNLDFIENYATVLCQAGDFAKAAEAAQRGLKIRKTGRLLGVSATSLLKLGHNAEALSQFDELLTREPRHPAALCERAIALTELHQHENALASVDAAIKLQPAFPEAYLNRGIVLRRLYRFEEALVAFEQAIKLRPQPAAWLGVGNTLLDMRRPEEALKAYESAITIAPDFADALLGRASAAKELGRFDEAIAAYDHAMELQPDTPALEGLRLYTKAHACDWRYFDQETERLLSSIRAGKPASPPFALLCLPSTGQDQLTCARSWVKLKYLAQKPLRLGKPPITIAFAWPISRPTSCSTRPQI